MVTKESAILDYSGCPKPYGINAHHMDMVRFAHRNAPGFSGIMNSFCDIIKSSTAAIPTIDQAPCAADGNPQSPSGAISTEMEAALREPEYELSTPWIPPTVPDGDEDPYSILRDYDTVIVIDDSGSMAGSLWRMTSTVLAQLVRRAVCFDTDGIDMHFFNSEKEQKNVGSARQVMQIFREVQPQRGTPTYRRLHSHLERYMRRLEADREIKGLNLIFITDGPPDNGAEEDIKDEIASVADWLKSLRASKQQVGIQFVQVGNDESASEFFKYIDDQIKGVRGLDRDVSHSSFQSHLSC